MIDVLINRIKETKNPTCVGLDTKLDFLPKEYLRFTKTNLLEHAAQNIFEFNRIVIDNIADIVPCVKVQSAYYEMYGYPGVEALYNTIAYAKECGMIVIADVKRGDIGETAKAYSKAYLGSVDVEGESIEVFNADFITVNAYLGIDGIKPFLEDCQKNRKGIFILVKTSNPSGGQIQDLVCEDKPIYMHMAELVEEWGKPFLGKNGYSSVGAVVGATWPKQAEEIREKFKNMFMLVPGYGAQGASANDIAVNFDKNGLGAIVNSSRAILTAASNPMFKDEVFYHSIRKAAIHMRDDILKAFEENKISY